MDIHQKVINGTYDNKLIYASKKADEVTWQAYKDESDRLYNQFKADALESVGLTNHPQSEKVWHKAWEDGHSSGYYEVLIKLEELTEIVK